MGSMDGDGAERRAREASNEDEDVERQHHTLTLAEGRAMRRELSRHQLFGGGELDVGPISSPDTTLGTMDAADLGAAIREDIAARGGGGVRGRSSVDGGGRRRDARVSFSAINEIIESSDVGEGRSSPPTSAAMKASLVNPETAAMTLNAMSGKELAAELKKTQTKMSEKANTAKKLTSSDSQRLSLDMTGSTNVLEGAEEKTRRAIKVLRTQTDALMFLADAIEAKELPGLAERMRERLNTIKESYHDLLSYEGLRQRKKGALKAARKVDILRGALGQTEQQDGRNLPTHSSDKPMQRKRDYQILGARMLAIGCVFFVLLLTPFIVTQYEQHEHQTACDVAEKGEVKLDHASEGQMEVNLLLGPCIYNAS